MDNQVDSASQAMGEPTSGVSLQPWQQDALVYAAVALGLSCFALIVNNSPVVRNAGFFLKVFAGLGGTALGCLGALVGNALRKAVHPDAVWTTGGFWSLLKTKIFWNWGPQTIGMLAGVLFGISFILA